MKKGLGKLLLVGTILTGILTGCGGEKKAEESVKDSWPKTYGSCASCFSWWRYRL